jgi:hypothetical protein
MFDEHGADIIWYILVLWEVRNLVAGVESEGIHFRIKDQRKKRRDTVQNGYYGVYANPGGEQTWEDKIHILSTTQLKNLFVESSKMLFLWDSTGSSR